MMRIALNGRFLSRPPTGVDRVAQEIIGALDRIIGEAQTLAFEAEILAPRAAQRALPLRRITTRIVGRSGGHPWEQSELAAAAGHRWLVNLCNTAPIARSRNLVLIHDAQVYQSPQSYSKSFRLAYRALLPLAARRSRIVMTVSRFSADELERYGVVPPGKILVSPNGCDHMDRIEADAGAVERWDLKGEPYLLVLGSLSAHKNMGTALEAARRAGVERVLVAGGGDARVFAGADLPDSPNARFIGRVSDGELKALYRNARALLFPSFFEGFGLPPLEAMRCGCPVIASTAPAVRETCGDAALYADPSHPDEWAAQIGTLMASEALRLEHAAAGLRRSEAFTWEASARRVLASIAEQEKQDMPARR